MEPAESTMLPPDLPASSFEDDNFTLFGEITDIHNVEFHYHLHPDDFRERSMDPWFPCMSASQEVVSGLAFLLMWRVRG